MLPDRSGGGRGTQTQGPVLGLRGAVADEFRMQIRRKALWMVVLSAAAVPMAATHASSKWVRSDTTTAMLAGDWSVFIG